MGSGVVGFQGLVVAVGVDGELSDDFSGGGVQHGDVVVLDQQQDSGSGVGAADGDVSEFAGVAECDDAVFADFVVSDAVVWVVSEASWCCFRHALVAGCWGRVVWQ